MEISLNLYFSDFSPIISNVEYKNKVLPLQIKCMVDL